MSNVGKAVLTQEQADILGAMSDIPVGELAFDYAEGEFVLVPKELRTLGLHTFMTALYVGYEVEKSSEEKVREIYCKYVEATVPQYSQQDVVFLISKLLDALDVSIEGVNA